MDGLCGFEGEATSLTPVEKAGHGMGVGAAGVLLRMRAVKNSRKRREAFGPASGMTGEKPGRLILVSRPGERINAEPRRLLGHGRSV